MAASKLISPCHSLGDFTSLACRPPSIVLDRCVCIGGQMNKDTIATVKSSDGHILEVSFWSHQPPDMSYFCVHCHRSLSTEPHGADYQEEPHMVAVEGRFVLLRTSFVSSLGQDEYFMYKAGNGESGKLASLDQVPLPGSYRLPRLKEFGIVPCGHGGHYLLAALGVGSDTLYYQLHIYSSEDQTWTRIFLQNPRPQIDKVITSKVITLGEGIIAWVDLQHGMLVCNLHEANPSARYIPLPDPLPGNKDMLQASHPGPSTKRFRDVTCINGVLKFVEMEHLVTTQKPSPPQKKFKVYDSELIMSRERKEPKLLKSWNGWKAVMWNRTISSDSWEMGSVIDAADIMLDDSMYLSLLSGLKDEADIDKIVFKDMYSAFPTLSTDADDVLYLNSVAKFSYPDGRIVAVDLGTRTVKALAEYSLAKHDPSVKAFGSCTVPQMTTGKVSASACVSIKQAPSSTRDPNNTLICANNSRTCESDKKRQRLSAEKINHAHNRAQNIMQNDHISLVRPAQNNLPSQQRFIKHYTPCYPHQNNQHYFNWRDGSHNPGYAPMAAPPKLPEYSNYQPLWQHSQPLEQWVTHSSVFGPHEESQLCFSYHGCLQQLPAPTSFAEGSNRQLQWQHAYFHGPLDVMPQGLPPMVHQLVPYGI